MVKLQFLALPDPPIAAAHSLLLLHGWGANAADLISLGSLLAPQAQTYAAEAPFPIPTLPKDGCGMTSISTMPSAAHYC